MSLAIFAIVARIALGAWGSPAGSSMANLSAWLLPVASTLLILAALVSLIVLVTGRDDFATFAEARQLTIASAALLLANLAWMILPTVFGRTH
ncbi:MAG TPA: hypothetical protein VH475_22870 [Tepidisphaeraceae bacterium]